MNIVSVVDILSGNITINSNITIRGWVRTRRDSKIGISFISMYDGSCLSSIQVITSNSLPNYNTEILKITTGCSLIVDGKVVLSPNNKQKIEVYASQLTVIGWVDDPGTYPISAKFHSIEYLREFSHLRPRSNLIGAVVRIRHTISNALHHFFNEQGYFWISTPLITASDTEGAGKMFRVSTLDMGNLPLTSEGKINYKKDFFGQESFLTVSGQLNVEAYACALSKVYTFGPTFRAENSNTSRHLAEFWMLEPEAAFANLEDIIELAKLMLKYVFKSVLNTCEDDIKYLSKFTDVDLTSYLDNFISNNIIQIEYNNAIDILKNCDRKFENRVSWGIDFSSEHERYLTDVYFKNLVIIKNFPKEIKAFYMRLNDDNRTVASMDILVPGIGEIIGGSQREERLNVLDKRMIEMGINKENYWWYRDLRKYGTVPHSGFGLGFDRLISFVTGLQNIRDVIPFPRTANNIKF